MNFFESLDALCNLLRAARKVLEAIAADSLDLFHQYNLHVTATRNALNESYYVGEKVYESKPLTMLTQHQANYREARFWSSSQGHVLDMHTHTPHLTTLASQSGVHRRRATPHL